jgi:multidrug efflux system outer membrane protein
MKLRPCLLLLSLALLAGGCAVGPNFKAPDAHPPATFRGAEETGTNSLGDLAWWDLFRDPILQDLVRTALTNNYDLRLAATRVEQARALLAQARAVYFPQVDYQAGVGGGRNSGNGVLSNNGNWKGSEVLGDVSWEIDLWGRIRRLNEAARAEYLATEEGRLNVMISLIASVAQAYFQLLALDTDLVIAQETTNSFGQSLTLFNQRLAGGVASKLESASAAAVLASAAATIPELRRQMVIQENQIRVLLGVHPGPVARPPGALESESLPNVPPGLPSDLLERRPDIRQATQLMRAANAQVGVAVADFFPRLNLTGLFGAVSPELLPLTAGTFGGWGVAASLAGPLFHGGALRGQLQQKRAEWEAATLQYQSTVLTAFQEVSDALVSQQELAQERIEQTRAVAAYQQAVDVANQRYRGGQASYYELLLQQQLLFPAQNILTPAQNILTRIVLGQLLATVQLYKALGGGWAVPAPEPAPASG